MSVTTLAGATKQSTEAIHSQAEMTSSGLFPLFRIAMQSDYNG